MNPRLKRALEIAIVPFAAAVVFVEQVLIRYLNRMMAAVSCWPPVARLEAWLMSLPPWAAVLAFAMPSIIILPVKASTLSLAADHRFALATRAVVLGTIR